MFLILLMPLNQTAPMFFTTPRPHALTKHPQEEDTTNKYQYLFAMEEIPGACNELPSKYTTKGIKNTTVAGAK